MHASDMSIASGEQPSLLEIARNYRRRGWCPIPVPHQEKAPVDREWQRLRYEEGQLLNIFSGRQQNIGIHLGEPSNGLIDIDLDCAEARVLAEALLPPTNAIFGRQSSSSAHRLYMATGMIPETRRFLAPGHGTLVELRSSGAQTIFPPSVHPTGEPIFWVAEGDPAEIDSAELLRCVGELATASLLTKCWKLADKQRHHLAMHLSGALLRSGWSPTRVEQWIRMIAQAAGDTDVPDRVKAAQSTADRQREDRPFSSWNNLEEVLDTGIVGRISEWLAVQRTVRAPEPIEALVDEFRATDVGNSHRLVRRHGENLHYDGTNQRWLIWDNHRWIPDDRLQVFEWAKDTVQTMHELALSLRMGTPERNDLQKWAKQSESSSRIDAMVKLSRSAGLVPVLADELDTNPWLLTLQNVTLDLRTGDAGPHQRDHLITRMVHTKWDPEAACPTWDRYLSTAMAGNTEMIGYIQRLVGYTLTGITSEQLMVFCYGPPDTGKTTLVETMASLLDEFAEKMPVDLLLTGLKDSGEYDLAKLKGARYAFAVEPGEERRLNISRVKELSGDDTIRGRNPYGKPFSFRPSHKIWLATNHQPNVRGIDEAIWTRLRVVPFEVQIPEADQDPQLKEKLKREFPGILRWAVEGCLAWQKAGLQTPDRVRNAVRAYKAENDIVASWAEMRLEWGDKDSRCTSESLHKDYTEWCRNHGEHGILTPNAFGRKFSSLAQQAGAKRVVGDNGRAGYLGVRVRPGLTLIKREESAG